jgi:D-alanine-D-alanine ligase
VSKQTIAIICGGPSSEHEVSCVSAGGVLKGLDKQRFEPLLIGITKSGVWVSLPVEYQLEIVDKKMPVIEDNGQHIELSESGFSINGQLLDIDCVFPVLHGEFGEDGQIQHLLDEAEMAYVGSGVSASAQAMDKAVAKLLFASSGMRVVDGVAVSAQDWHNAVDSLEYPVFVKPSSGGSSRGTHKVKSAEGLKVAITDALLYDSKVLIETAIVGREIECAVLERDGMVEASIVGEIIVNPKFEFYDFEAKYLDDATTVKIPADIPEVDADEIRRLAVAAFHVLGCSGLARCDFFYTKDGEIIINEVNTMPGFTGTSVYPKLWQASGVTYTELISAIIDTALSS